MDPKDAIINSLLDQIARTAGQTAQERAQATVAIQGLQAQLQELQGEIQKLTPGAPDGQKEGSAP